MDARGVSVEVCQDVFDSRECVIIRRTGSGFRSISKDQREAKRVPSSVVAVMICKLVAPLTGLLRLEVSKGYPSHPRIVFEVEEAAVSRTRWRCTSTFVFLSLRFHSSCFPSGAKEYIRHSELSIRHGH